MENIAKIKEELKNKNEYTSKDLDTLTKVLRSKEGCPWDREQDSLSLRSGIMEECYEMIEALEEQDPDHLCEEAGDVLLQVYMQSTIAEEKGQFTINDVYKGICRKMIERHPHVFGEIKVKDSEEVLKNWDNIKIKEKNTESIKSQFERVSKTYPSLITAQKYAKRAYKYGIETESLQCDFPISKENVGQILFSVCAFCSQNGLEAEGELRDFCKDFLKKIPEDTEKDC